MLPLPGFEEVDLLQREYRIDKMDTASTELAREEEQKMLTKKKGREENVHRCTSLKRSGSSSGCTQNRCGEKETRSKYQIE